MEVIKQPIWSGSDFPYQCLVDAKRTEAFRAAILTTVKPNDVVLDAGAGSGILSFFAAQAGAKLVVAVEIDPYLADCLERSVRANRLSDTIKVLCGDVCSVALPSHVDVFIGEMIDTGLIDEMQVEVINRLQADGVLTGRTRMIPARYETYVALGVADLDYYGFRILLPQHRWPHCAQERAGWLPARFDPTTEPIRVAAANFHARMPTAVEQVVVIPASSAGEVNAVRISGRAHLTGDISLGATNAFNGDKILPIEPIALHAGHSTRVSIRYTLGAGLSSLRIEAA